MSSAGFIGQFRDSGPDETPDPRIRRLVELRRAIQAQSYVVPADGVAGVLIRRMLDTSATELRTSL